MVDELYIGRRLSYASTRCTVRYFGELQGTTGEWLGVEWDNPSRGKHNGSHDGVRYFDCQSGSATAASFVRPSRSHDPPLSFLGALAKKYASDEHAEFLSRSKILISGKTVEEIGFEEIRQRFAALNELQLVLLDGLCVVGVHTLPWIDSSELHLQAQRRIAAQKLKIVELDLSRNLLEKWIDVASICAGLKSLKRLTLNSNRFSDLSLSSFDRGQEPFLQVEELSLDDTLLSWDDIVNITNSFPSLTSLSVSSNNIRTITAPLLIPRLKILILASNAFQSLDSLSFLTSTSSLTRLSLRSNLLKTVVCQTPLRFPNVAHLDLTLTLISSVACLSALTLSFPSLRSIVTNKTPLSILPSSSLFTIARLPSLTSLNYSVITSTERQNAELYYLSVIARELSATPLAEASQILANHPRYKDLCAIYGEPEIVTKARLAGEPKPGTLEARIVRFTFRMKTEGANGAEETTVEKKQDIPRTIDVYRLKGIVGRLFGIRPIGCKLIWETGEWDPVKGEEDGWSCSEEEEIPRDAAGFDYHSGAEKRDDFYIEEAEKQAQAQAHEQEQGQQHEKKHHNHNQSEWTRREIELEDSTRDVGFWIDGREAVVRVERR